MVHQESGLRRTVVVGTSCSGKTTFARKLSSALGVNHIELDTLYWKPDWVESSTDEFRNRVERAAAADRWVADGNYTKARDLLWARATDVIWLNYSLPVVFKRALSRTVRRAVTQQELFAGNRETLRRSFFSRDSILLWVLTTFRKNRRRYAALRTAQEWRHIRFTELRSSSAAEEFLARLRPSLTG